MKTYTLVPSGRSEIAATLARFCAPGKFGAPLIEKGFSQALFAHAIAGWAKAAVPSLSVAEIATALESLSACNASAARQALESCALDFGPVLGKDGKPDGEKREQLGVKAHWAKLSPTSAPVDTSKLGF